MSWTTPPQITNNTLVDDVYWNTYVVNNLKSLPRVIARAQTQVDVVSTVAKTTVFTFSLPANTLGTSGGLLIRMFGDYRNDSGVNRTMTLTADFGATAILSYGPTLIDANTDRYIWDVEIDIAAGNATNVQRSVSRVKYSNATGNAAVAALTADVIGRHESMAVDTTAAVTVTLAVQHSVSDATVSFRMQNAYAIVMPPT